MKQEPDKRVLISAQTRQWSVTAVLLMAACSPESDVSTTKPAFTPASAAAIPAQGAAAGAPASAGTASVGTSSASTATGSAQASATTGSTAAAAAPGEALPCAVGTVLKANCQNCHSAMPIGGAPMPLVTHADLMKPAHTQPTKKVYELVHERIHDMDRPMPPIGTLMPADIQAIDAWVQAGAMSASEADVAGCADAKPKTSEWEGAKALDGSRGKLTAGPGETCYEFMVHGDQTADDKTKFPVNDGEGYEQFYYKIPWPAGTVATAYATVGDNVAVLHHWLLFSTNELKDPGAHNSAPYPTLIGTDPILLAGWAVGGPNLVAPDDVGFELPVPEGRTLNVQWHFYNSTGKPQTDASVVQICTVPAAMRTHIGGVTWLGTEDLYGNKWFGGQGMPAHQKSTFTTTCTPGRAGVGANEPIHILGFEPHMHRIGKHMTTTVKKMDGTMKTLLDEPFSFGNETHYFSDYDLLPGEELITTCSFDNTNDFGVMFGESSDTEMCYQFAFSYPAHALTNGAPSILGVPDTCWGSTTPTQVTAIQ